MKKFLFLQFSILIFVNSLFLAQNDSGEINSILKNWITSFNEKNLSGALSIYSEKFIGYYPNQPDQNFTSIKEQYESIFKNKNLSAKLELEVLETTEKENFAYVSMILTATIKPAFSPQAAIAHDKGIQIWEKEITGNWKLIRSSTFPIQNKD